MEGNRTTEEFYNTDSNAGTATGKTQ